MIYLDHNATTPPRTRGHRGHAAGAVQRVGQHLITARSRQEPKRALGAARAPVARLLGCKPVEVIFTSGATEANHLAVRGLLAAAAPGRQRVVFSSVEHSGHLRLGGVRWQIQVSRWTLFRCAPMARWTWQQQPR